MSFEFHISYKTTRFSFISIKSWVSNKFSTNNFNLFKQLLEDKRIKYFCIPDPSSILFLIRFLDRQVLFIHEVYSYVIFYNTELLKNIFWDYIDYYSWLYIYVFLFFAYVNVWVEFVLKFSKILTCQDSYLSLDNLKFSPFPPFLNKGINNMEK